MRRKKEGGGGRPKKRWKKQKGGDLMGWVETEKLGEDIAETSVWEEFL